MIQEPPSLAEFRFRIENRWLGGDHNRTTVKASHGAGQDFPERDGKFSMEADEPEVLLSGGRAADPVEHLLHALVSCGTSTATHHVAARHIPVESVQSELVGDLDLRGFLGLDPEVPKRCRSVTMRMRTGVPPVCRSPWNRSTDGSDPWTTGLLSLPPGSGRMAPISGHVHGRAGCSREASATKAGFQHGWQGELPASGQPWGRGPSTCHDGAMAEPEPDSQPFAVPGGLVLAAMVSLGIIAVLVALAASFRVFGPAGA